MTPLNAEIHAQRDVALESLIRGQVDMSLSLLAQGGCLVCREDATGSPRWLNTCAVQVNGHWLVVFKRDSSLPLCSAECALGHHNGE